MGCFSEAAPASPSSQRASHQAPAGLFPGPSPWSSPPWMHGPLDPTSLPPTLFPNHPGTCPWASPPTGLSPEAGAGGTPSASGGPLTLRRNRSEHRGARPQQAVHGASSSRGSPCRCRAWGANSSSGVWGGKEPGSARPLGPTAALGQDLRFPEPEPWVAAVSWGTGFAAQVTPPAQAQSPRWGPRPHLISGRRCRTYTPFSLCPLGVLQSPSSSTCMCDPGGAWLLQFAFQFGMMGVGAALCLPQPQSHSPDLHSTLPSPSLLARLGGAGPTPRPCGRVSPGRGGRGGRGGFPPLVSRKPLGSYDRIPVRAGLSGFGERKPNLEYSLATLNIHPLTLQQHHAFPPSSQKR